MRLLISFFILCLSTLIWAESAPVSWYQLNEKQQAILRVDLFLSTTCPHCKKADAFFKTLQTQNSWLDVHRFYINTNKADLEKFSDYLNQFPKDVDAYGVPAMFFCQTEWVGFVDAATTGQKLLKGLEYCRDQINKSGSLTPETVATIQQWSSASWYEGTITGNPATWYFIPAMAFMDVLSPCALFVLLTVTGLVLLQNSLRQQLIVAAVFLLALVGVHYFQQLHTSLYYSLLTWLRIPAIIAGLMLITYAVFRWRNPSLPRALVVVVTAVAGFILQAYQQNCVPNFSLIFQQWLNTQSVTPGWKISYQFFYQVSYLFAQILLIFLVFRGLTHWKKPSYQQVLVRIALIILLVTGVILVIEPTWLARLFLSFIILWLAVALGWVIYLRRNKD